MGNSKSGIAGGQRFFFSGDVRGRFVCWNPPKWSFSLTARLTQTRLHSSLRCRALHGCGCLGAKFQVQRCRRRLTRVETMKFQIGNRGDSRLETSRPTVMVNSGKFQIGNRRGPTFFFWGTFAAALSVGNPPNGHFR